MASSNESYFIIGAGVFGASTALRLILEKPWAKITLVDRTPFPNHSSASHDRGKIIRADYTDLFYAKLALEARRIWEEDPLYRQYYHPTGFVIVDESGIGNAVIKNYKALGGVDAQAGMLSLEDARGQWKGVFRNTKCDGAEEVFWNPNSGWAEVGALTDTIKEAILRGVEYLEATALSLILDATGACLGIRTKDDELRADHTILCTGAFTARLLADTAPSNKELQVSGRLLAAGAVSCTATVAPELISQFKGAPVLFVGLDDTQVSNLEDYMLTKRLPGECLPLNEVDKLKFNCENTFTRMEHHAGSHQHISAPPLLEKYSTWGPGSDVPKGLRDEVDSVVRNMFGLRDIEVESYRMCWDAITPNQDFLIGPHPHCRNLFLATGGSFHGYKFLPTIGKYVVQMLDGTLDEEAVGRWAWDRANKGAACMMYIPKRDITDIDGSDMHCI